MQEDLHVFILVPESVRHLQVSHSVFNSKSEATVYWREPIGGDDVNQYYIEWYQNGTDQQIEIKSVEHLAEKVNYTFTISNLQPATTYKVLIRGSNSAGNGSHQTTYITTSSYRLLVFNFCIHFNVQT